MQKTGVGDQIFKKRVMIFKRVLNPFTEKFPWKAVMNGHLAVDKVSIIGPYTIITTLV